jgi:hypothetical protein
MLFDYSIHPGCVDHPYMWTVHLHGVTVWAVAVAVAAVVAVLLGGVGV